jgi:predicted cobalt transporter CbtA
MLSMRTLLVWGMLAGLLAGVLAFGFAAAFGEPPVEVAISLEEQGVHDHEEGPVSRDIQSTLGLAIATCLFGVALGGLLALAFAFAYGRIGPLSPRHTALVTTLLGFVAAFLVPYLVYPPNPPAVGREDTIDDRTVAYFGMMAISVLLAVAAVYASRRIGVLISAVGYILAVAVVAALFPRFAEVPDGFPAQVLWEFRLASLGTQAVLWATLGVAFAFLLDRATNRATASGVAAG